MRTFALSVIAVAVTLVGCSTRDVTFTGPNGGDDDDELVDAKLTALEPAIASTGDTVTLEGTFGHTAVVTFPGGVTQDAIVLGPHRATVVVPAGATHGDLTVTSGGSTTTAVGFRHTTFPLGLSIDGAGSPHTTGNIPVFVQQHTAIALGDQLYVIGGVGDGGGSLATVQRATMNADGTLGPFSVATETSLMTARSAHSMVRIGTSVYAIGGVSGGPLASVERAEVQADGSLGPFAIVPDVTLQNGRSGHTSVVIGTSVYVVGGTNGLSLGTVERAEILADGTLGSFALVPDVTLQTARENHASVLVKDSLYIIGGIHGGSLNSVERAVIAPDGTLGPFTIAAQASLVTARDLLSCDVIGNTVYAIAGESAFRDVNSIERATIADDGTIGAFEIDPTISIAEHRGHTTTVVGNNLYVVGYTDTRRFSLIGQGSVLGTFEPVVGTVMTKERQQFSTVAVGSYVYALGDEITATVERAKIGSDGSFGAFAQLTDRPLTQTRDNAMVAVTGNKIRVMSGTSLPQLAVATEGASIGPDGSISVFAATDDLLNRRTGGTAVVVGDSLFLIAGSVQGPDSVDCAKINSDGSLGTFTTLAPRLVLGRSVAPAVVLGNFLYVVAGLNLDALDSVERATIGPGCTLGTFSTFKRLQTARTAPTLAVIGDGLYVVGGYRNGGSAESSVERAAIAPDGTVGEFSLVPGVNVVTPRYFHATTTIGNYVYLLGGLGGSGAGSLATLERAPIMRAP